MATALMAACKPLPPRGAVPVEEAAALPEVWAEPDDGASVRIALALRAGSATDPIGQEGRAWVAAHAWRHGGAGPWSGPALDDQLRAWSARLDVTTARELVQVSVDCGTADRTACFDLVGAWVQAPRFDAAALGAAREAALAWLDAPWTDGAAAFAVEVLDAWLFLGHPYGHPVRGRAGAVPLLDQGAARAWVSDRFRRVWVAGAVAGPVTEADAAALQARLAALPGTLPLDERAMAPAPSETRAVLVVGAPTTETVVAVGQPCGTDQAAAARVLQPPGRAEPWQRAPRWAVVEGSAPDGVPATLAALLARVRVAGEVADAAPPDGAAAPTSLADRVAGVLYDPRALGGVTPVAGAEASPPSTCLSPERWLAVVVTPDAPVAVAALEDAADALGLSAVHTRPAAGIFR